MAFYHTSLHRFLVASLALHTAVFLLLDARPPPARVLPEAIPVSLIPAPPKSEGPAVRPAHRAPVAPAPGPSPAESRKIARSRESAPAPSAAPTAPSPEARVAQEPRASRSLSAEIPPKPVPSDPPERNIIVPERELPTLKELLPPAAWASSGSRSTAPISLNTRDPVYVSYFNKIKQSIEVQWEYPEVALRYGLQGRLALEFSIGPNGELERVRILRSSGSQVLDDEALRAIKAAAPFPPIPPWIKANPLSISASMEYHDNRLHYQPGR